MININVNSNTEPKLVGEREASTEEQELLDSIMDTMEQAIHGEFRDDIVRTLDSHPDLWKTSSQTATMLITRVAHKLDEQEVPYDSSVFFGQNGAIQQTVQMLWEIGDAMGHPAAENEEQMQASYMATLQQLGDTMIDDEESAKEAQAFLLQEELGEDIVGLAAEEMEMEAEENLLAQNDREDDPSMWDLTKVRSRHAVENIINMLSPSIGPSSDPDDDPDRRALRVSKDREVQVRDRFDPNEAMRRRMIEAGLEDDNG